MPRSYSRARYTHVLEWGAIRCSGKGCDVRGCGAVGRGESFHMLSGGEFRLAGCEGWVSA